MKLEIHISGKTRLVELSRENGRLRISLDGISLDADAVEVVPNTYSILLAGESHEVQIAPLPGGRIKLHTGLAEFVAEIADPRSWRGRKHGALEAEGRQPIVAPMPGKVIRLLVKEGDPVETAQGLVVVEAMKMQNEVRSPKNGKVERLLAKEGQAVNAGEILGWVE
ncbi:MAG TPA: biotin/lipoyl-containing protein [Candidatus Acidoferrum sp.]|nr:biotin/lipoyl-containing protein [Candidatus Acidoferrum sp.]